MTHATAGPRATAREGTRAMEAADAPGPSAPPRGDASETNELLRALLAVNGRLAFPEERLRSLVSPTGAPAYWLAYKMCDGRTSLTDIAKEVGIDLGNFSRSVNKWVEAGIAFRVGSKRLPLHLYPLTVDEAKARAAAKTAGAPEPVKRAARRAARKAVAGEAAPAEGNGAGSNSGDGNSSDA